MKKKTGNLKTVLLTLLFFTGLGLMLYPMTANWWNQRRVGRTISTYNASLEHLDTEIEEELLEKARAYNETLPEDPGRFFPDEQDHAAYMQQLNLNDTDIMGSVEIPIVGICFPIYHGTSAEVLNTGVGHLEGSSLPVGGKTSHCALSGHRGLPSMEIFDRIPELEKGDLIFLRILNQTYTYQVDSQTTVEPQETKFMDFVPDEDRLTLITCTPYGINTHRMLVGAHRIENFPGMEDTKATKKLKLDFRQKLVILAAILVVCAFVLVWWRRRRRNRKNRGRT